jgi:hypothetical protein
MASIEDIAALDGHTVGLAFELPDVKVYRVEGPGLSTQVRDDDADTLQTISDSHDERVQQQNETRPETMLRWHSDPDNTFELDDDALEATRREAEQLRAVSADT